MDTATKQTYFKSGRKAAAGFVSVLIGVLALFIGVSTMAAAADVNPTSVYDVDDGPGGNASCAEALAGKPVPATTQLGGQGGFGDDGVKSDGVLSVTTSGFAGGSLSFSVTGVDPDVRVYAVLIKQTNATRVYYYADGVKVGDSDAGLTGINQGISNYKLCYAVVEPDEETTTTVDETTTTVEETTTTVEETTTTVEETTTTAEVEGTVVTPEDTTEETVAGVQVGRELPRTGSSALLLTGIGALLVGFGLVLLDSSRGGRRLGAG